MEVVIKNLADIIREKIVHVTSLIDDKYISSKEADCKIYEYFNALRKRNNVYYKNVVGLLASDHYKILLTSLDYRALDEEDKSYLDLYEEISDISSIIEDNPEMLDILISKSYEFLSYDYFSKREILFRCMDKSSKLNELSCFNKYDYMYYCCKYNVGTIKEVYNACKINGIDKNTIIKLFIKELNKLYLSDSDNYFEFISEIFIMYYKIGVYELKHDKMIPKPSRINKAIKLLKKQDIDTIIHKTSDDCFMEEVFLRIINFNNRYIDNDYLNDEDMSVVKKLSKIKEYYD